MYRHSARIASYSNYYHFRSRSAKHVKENNNKIPPLGPSNGMTSPQLGHISSLFSSLHLKYRTQTDILAQRFQPFVNVPRPRDSTKQQWDEK